MIHRVDPKLLKLDATGVAIVVGLAVVAYFAQIAPVRGRHDQAKADSMELAQQQSKQRELDRTLRNTKDQLDVALRETASAQLRLEAATELNRKLARLTELASQHTLQVDSIESGATTQGDKYAATSIRLGGRGSYRNCSVMLHEIRAAMPDIGVVSVQMSSVSPGVNGNSATTANFVFELLWYTTPQPAAVKK
jgi:Tfp pilus assembly protein PilO